MNLDEAIEGFLLNWVASGKSQHTARIYKSHLQNMVNYLDNPPIDKITHNDLVEFMVYLRTEHVPRRLHGDTSPYSDAAIANHFKGIRALFTYAEKVFDLERPDDKIDAPKYQLPEVRAFTEEEVKLIAKHSGKTFVERPDGRAYWYNLPSGKRDRAIVFLLLDTGIRVGELCRLQVKDIHMEAREITIRPYGSGQKSKARTVAFYRRTQQVLWLYIKDEELQNGDSLFEMTTSGVRSMLWRLGKRSGIKKVHPHRFRHTFAIMFLRNGGDIYTLQHTLGHRSLDMVKHYLDISMSDVKAVHAKASPVERLRL